MVPLDSIHKNPKNPRIIKDEKFKKLVQSIKDFPAMMKIRPIVVDDTEMILGGNMRYEGCKELKWKLIPVIHAKDLTEDQKKEFIVKDNVPFGEFDWAELANEWDKDELIEWGFDEYMFGIKIDDTESDDSKDKEVKEKKLHKCPACGNEFSD
ncbi:MAG: ParB N-terminal domain-containing protein [Paludibacter sp.]|nr:ParB N-terminal domain-containing protein [Paludibacter sp.]